MVAMRHSLLLIALWVSIIRGEPPLNFNATEEDDESSELINQDQPAYPQSDDVMNTTEELGDLCNGGGYAVYDNGLYTAGTASCDEPGTFCCMDDQLSLPEEESAEARQSPNISGTDSNTHTCPNDKTT